MSPTYFINVSPSGLVNVPSTNPAGLSVLTATANACNTPNCFDLPMSLSFALNQTANYTSLTQMFDKYRIAGVKIRIKASSKMQAGGSTWNSDRGSILIQRYTTSSNVANMTAQLDNQNEILRFASDGQCKNLYRKPSVIGLVGKPSTGVQGFTYFPGSSPQWISGVDPDVMHSGINFFWRGIDPAQVPFLAIDVEYLVDLMDQV